MCKDESEERLNRPNRDNFKGKVINAPTEIQTLHKFFFILKIMMIQKFIEVPNTGIREPVLSDQFDSELCLMIADDYGYAEIVWYALNGKRVVEGSYGDPKLVGIHD